jgi:RNA polymerase sigma-70 factor (sigma-E family)
MGLRWRRRDGQGRDAEFVAFYAARGDHISNTAYLMCGDWHLAHDLNQTTFAKLYRHWHRVERHDALDQYARKVLLRAMLDERRRPWRREYPTGDDAALDRPVVDPDPQEHRSLHAALAAVPARQRAALILRYWADLSVDQIAEVLGCSAGIPKGRSEGTAGIAGRESGSGSVQHQG